MRNKKSILGIVLMLFALNVFSQTGYITGTWESCPASSLEYPYQVYELPSGCTYNWQVTNGGLIKNGTSWQSTLSTTSTSIEVKWSGEPDYANVPNGYFNDGKYPVGLVKVNTSGCSNSSNNGKAPADYQVTITSVKNYQIYAININGTMRSAGTTVDFTNQTGTVTVNCGSVPVNYPPTPLGFIRTVYPSGYRWTLPEGWTATGYSGQSFIAGSSLTLTPPCWGYTAGTTRDLKVRIITPEVCLVNNQLQEGADYVVKFKRDAPYIVNFSPVTLSWGVNTNFTAYATCNRTDTDLQYVWTLPTGYKRTSTGSGGTIITSTPYLDISFTGCNTTEKVSLKVQKSCGSSIVYILPTTFIYPTISGPGIVCSGGSTYTISNYPPGSTFLWTYSSNIQNVSGSGTNSVNVKSIGNNANGLVKARITSPNGCYYDVQLTPWVGTQTPGAITYEMDAPPRRFTACTYGASTASSYNWYCDGVLNNAYHIDCAIFTRKSPYCGREYRVQVSAINQCGASPMVFKSVYEPPCGKQSSLIQADNTSIPGCAGELGKSESFSIPKTENSLANSTLIISPNPASNFIKIDCDLEINMTDQNEIKVSNSLGKIVFRKNFKSFPLIIETENMDSGLYYVTVNSKNCLLKEKVIIAH